jgi:uncharacterized surface protein with fasciclin (FAS1) repeats
MDRTIIARTALVLALPLGFASFAFAGGDGKCDSTATASCESGCSTAKAVTASHDKTTCGHEHSANSIAAIAAKNGNFNTLAAALKQAELEEMFAHEGPFTVFAPTDEAFAKLPAEKLDALLKPENKAMLVAVLQNHVVKGEAKSCCASEKSSLAALNGKELQLKTVDGKLLVNGATVVTANVAADNGVIHAIDTVLLPEGM